MIEPGKRGSSRRKGDEYQDLTALNLALENYIARNPFEMFLEYEKSGNLDDIVIFSDKSILAYQVKYAVNSLEVYEVKDLSDPKSPVNLKKFADSWKSMKKRFPDYKLTICLCSNRSLDAVLVDLVNSDGTFCPEVIEDRRRDKAKKLRSKLLSVSGLNNTEFTAFLTDFKFVLRQPPIPELEQRIKTILLEKELGFSDNTIFLDLKEVIKNNAIFSRDAITIQSIDKQLERLQSQLLIPQLFPINHNHFVERKSFSGQLDHILSQTNSGYVIVTGLPGSGKSTSLTTYFETLKNTNLEIFRYYCFVDVNDNAQKMRIQSESLRANLLSEFHRKYPNVLERRFDYSEQNFLKSLSALAKFFVDQGRRFIIFLDGLDHAEKLAPEIRETVLSALPKSVPEGVIIVIGTQDLHKWPLFLKQAKECPERYIQMPLFSEDETRDYLENKRKISGLSHADITEIHKKCEGLPLYLCYAAETLISSDSTPNTIIANLMPALDGNIRNYYSVLWDEFEQTGMAKSKHLCIIMTCAHFNLHRDELFSISALDRPTFEDTFKHIRHLLRNSNERLTIFHNSFREFVFSQVPKEWVNEIWRDICSFLKNYKDSPRWFIHVFKYCYDIEDYQYILNEVNAEFVERALLHCRPSQEIHDAIHWAIESAFKQQDLVQLSRLGSLKFRTNERLEHNLDRTLIADVLLALNREQDVINFAFASDENHWLVDNYTALAVMSKLAEKGRMELGHKLFNVFTKEFHDTHSDRREETKSKIINIAKCLGIYMKRQAGPIRWLSQFDFVPDTLEQKDLYAPGYAPHLAAYIDALVKYGYTDKWKRLKHLKILFPNKLIQYLLIRALARYELLDELKISVIEYLKNNQASGNVELAFYAAKVGMPASDVSAIAGTIEIPKMICPDYVSPGDPTLKHFAYSVVVMSYEDSASSYTSLCETFSKANYTLWVSALKHILKACYCIGRSFRNDKHDWYVEACDCINILINTKQAEGERICESIDLIRNILPFTIGLLSEQIQRCFPEYINEWIEYLKLLRNSILWSIHFGINESIQNYNFELTLWESLASIHPLQPKLASILKNCAETYEKSPNIKGGSRSQHFLKLASIMAKCGMRDDADKWLRYGIRSSLIYGYHKDVTLLYLIDILNLVNQSRPELALKRCKCVLSMVDWMPYLTDGRETDYFPEEIFKSIDKIDCYTAFDLLKHFSRSKARWQMQDCMEEYLLNIANSDPEYLWCLTELFANHYSDDGRHCKQIMRVRQHIVDMVQKYCAEETYIDFKNRFNHFILTEITPRHWPDSIKQKYYIQIDSDNQDNSKTLPNFSHEYKLDNEIVTSQDIIKRCKESLPEFFTVIEKLKNQNEYFYESALICEPLLHHIANAKSEVDLNPIMKFTKTYGNITYSSIFEILANQFFKFGNHDNAIECLGMAYACIEYNFQWRYNKKYLETIAALNKNAVKSLVVSECYKAICKSNGGYDTPPIAATGLHVLGEYQLLEDVFNDFLEHCQGMFVQLPQDNNYEWLKEHNGASVDLNQLILGLIIDELSTVEVDHGNRLIRAVSKLAIARPFEVIPPLITRLLTENGRVQRRLLTVFHCIADQRPALLVLHQKTFVQLFERNDFFCRQIILHLLRNIGNVSPLDSSVANSVKCVELNYSTNVYHSSYRMPSNPNIEFITFFKRNTLFDFSRQVILLEKILCMPSGSLFASIEERLKAQNWSIIEELERVKDDWHGHVHPQGWPVVFITTEFQELVTDILYNVLDEAVSKLTLSSEQVNWLWQTIQPADPEYVLQGMMPRPSDIPQLYVQNKQIWFKEFEPLESVMINNTKTNDSEDEWLTIFENRSMAQEEEYNLPYRQEISLKSFLIPQQIYGNFHELGKLDLKTETIAPSLSMTVTIKQVQAELKSRGQGSFDKASDCIPLIAEHQNCSNFLGYWNVCCFSSLIIEKYDLLFEGNSLLRNGEVISKYEPWQEGYRDETYSREKLSLGVRLIARRSFLAELCNYYQKILCVSIQEKRDFFKSIYKPSSDESRESQRYILYYF